MNQVTPRVFIAATRQNDGKTTMSLGLLAAMQRVYPRIGYIKPVGQRFVAVEENKIDEDSVLMNQVYQLNCPLVDMSPIAVEPNFTRRYLERANYDVLVGRIQTAFDRVAWEKDFVLCEGSGHAGVARLLGAKVIIVSQGGIGKPIDEVSLNQALFEKEGVEILGVILNKVLGKKVEFVTDFARRGLRRKGLELLGVVPHQPLLCSPTLALIAEELQAKPLNQPDDHHPLLVEEVMVGAMGVHHTMAHLRDGLLLITPADREDLILAVATSLEAESPLHLAGIVLTGGVPPGAAALRAIERLPFPVLLADGDSYQVASSVHTLTVKTRSTDRQKIALIRDLIAKHVDVARIIQAL
jgi:BioD-like phosphotransacetylase family protein